MRALIAVLILTLAIAVSTSVFVVWGVVADAPWEDGGSVPAVDRMQEIRCQGAYSLRESVIAAGRLPNGLLSTSDFEEQLAKAEREIRLYC